MQVPQRVNILAVEVEDARTLGTQLTPRLRAAFPQVVEQVLSKLAELGLGPMATPDAQTGNN
jgi:hypothetical protein